MVRRMIALSLLAVFLLGLLLLSGCSKKECYQSSDCATDKCHTAKCQDNKCAFVAKPNCCGNAKCEADFGENKCICPADCGGKCGGKVTYNVSTTRGSKMVESKYAQYLCDAGKQCVIGADPSVVTEHPLSMPLEERGIFKADIVTTFNLPFITRDDVLGVRITLNDISETVIGGVSFTKIKVMSGASLMGEKIISKKLSNVGEQFNDQLTLSSSQSLVEEEKTVNVEVYYEYIVLNKGVQEIIRSSKSLRLPEKMTVIVP